ncbi:MAG: GNAT family N-acetyltransferase [Candidatus Levybacteria bacterium]|nr:GNAT family N-acetyltransferase [Candidatus Levybacteria bacterium]
MNIVIKPGVDLSSDELNQIKEALFREFKYLLPPRNQLGNRLFFLLIDKAKILSMGALKKVKPVIFNGEEFSLLGFVSVVANEKGKGYGKQVVMAMRDYLTSNNISGIGFTMPKNRGFYEKCGFSIEVSSTQRFVYKKGNENITNQDGQVIFYLDSSDRFMEKVLANPSETAFIPTDKLW